MDGGQPGGYECLLMSALHRMSCMSVSEHDAARTPQQQPLPPLSSRDAWGWSVGSRRAHAHTTCVLLSCEAVVQRSKGVSEHKQSKK